MASYTSFASSNFSPFAPVPLDHERYSEDKMTVSNEKPKRPLSAYNIFFQRERERILREIPDTKRGGRRKSHGKIGFANLARSVAAKWKCIDPQDRQYYEQLAAENKIKYKKYMEEWNMQEANLSANKRQLHSCSSKAGTKIESKVISDDKVGYFAGRFDANIFGACNKKHEAISFVEKKQLLNFEVGVEVQPLPIRPSAKILSAPAHNRSHISELANKLDDESMQLLSGLIFM